MATQYNKPALTIDEQIKLLRSRSLVINDEQFASHFLNYVGYYRLAGYWQIFQLDKKSHAFIPSSNFETIIDLYNFDRELRLLVYDIIERLEIAVRSVMVNVMSIAYNDPYWFANENLAEYEDRYQDNLDCIEAELARSKEEFISHHDANYDAATYPPAWKTIQVLSLGTLSKLYRNIKFKGPDNKPNINKKQIALQMGLPRPEFLESWMQAITILRNLCAHHSRICNRRFSFLPRKLHNTPYPWLNTPPADEELLFSQLSALKFLTNKINPGNHFTERLKAVFARYPAVSEKSMGFSDEWSTEPVWAINNAM